MHRGLGQACHSLSGAWLQARERYALACRLDRGVWGSRVRLLDIGTGLGLNLAAALWALDRPGTGQAFLDAHSFEIAPEVLRLAAALEDWPAEIERYHQPLRAAMLAAAQRGVAHFQQAGVASIWFHVGDARVRLPECEAAAGEGAPRAFDAVFLDPFSPQVQGDLWSEEFLQQVAARMATPGILSTYSASFRVRSRLVALGLEVGRGPRVGTKSSGTLAAKGLKLEPLEPRTQRRLARHRPRCA